MGQWHGGKGSARRPGEGYNTGWDLVWNKTCQYYFNGTEYNKPCHKSKCTMWDLKNHKCRWE